MLTKPENKALSKAKIQIMQIKTAVFYFSILFSLNYKWEDSIETACVDGTNMFINPEWFLSLQEKERIGLLFHEVLHIALDHLTRRDRRHPIIWNYAGDYVINGLLKQSNYTLVSNSLYDSKYANMSTEQVYNIIFKEIEQNKKNGGLGADGITIPGGSDIIYPKDSKELKTTKKKIARLVSNAQLTAKAANINPGHIPGEALINLEETINPQLPWNVILENYLNNIAHNDYSWSRPNRRYQNIYLPSLYSEGIDSVAIYFDLSGSVSPEEINKYVTEASALQYMLQPEKLFVIGFDTQISSEQEFSKSSNLLTELKLKGRGGTNISPVFDHIKKNKPYISLIFTDGHFTIPSVEKQPNTHLIWLIHNNLKFTISKGKIIHYKIKEK